MAPRTILLYVHPLAALATLALAVYTASLGFRGRDVTRDSPDLRRRHARIGPWLWTLVVLNWSAGLATVWWLREDAEPAASGHFTLGSVIAAVFTAAAIASRRVGIDPRARVVHPILGATAIVLSGVQVFLGLQLLP